jgi:hypothetical protein
VLSGRPARLRVAAGGARLKVWVGGHGFDVADGESGSAAQTRMVSGSAGATRPMPVSRVRPHCCGDGCYLACVGAIAPLGVPIKRQPGRARPAPRRLDAQSERAAAGSRNRPPMETGSKKAGFRTTSAQRGNAPSQETGSKTADFETHPRARQISKTSPSHKTGSKTTVFGTRRQGSRRFQSASGSCGFRAKLETNT